MPKVKIPRELSRVQQAFIKRYGDRTEVKQTASGVAVTVPLYTQDLVLATKIFECSEARGLTPRAYLREVVSAAERAGLLKK